MRALAKVVIIRTSAQYIIFMRFLKAYIVFTLPKCDLYPVFQIRRGISLLLVLFSYLFHYEFVKIEMYNFFCEFATIWQRFLFISGQIFHENLQ